MSVSLSSLAIVYASLIPLHKTEQNPVCIGYAVILVYHNFHPRGETYFAYVEIYFKTHL